MIDIKKAIIVLSAFVPSSDYKYSLYTHFHARNFIKRGFRVFVMAPYGVLPLFGIFKKNYNYQIDGIEVSVLKKISLSSIVRKCFLNINGFLYYLSVRKKIASIMKDNDVVYIDTHNFQYPGYTVYKLKKKYPNLFCTVTFHGTDLEQALTYKKGVQRLIEYAKVIDYYVCVSDKLYKKIVALGIKNVVTIYNGIEMYPVKKMKREKVFITAGYFFEVKKFDLLIDAFSIFCKKNTDYILKIIGDGEVHDKIVAQIKRLNLEDRIELLGALPNEKVFDEFSKAYSFILTSSPEGFGIVYPEAMYCGCVTIGTKNEGIDGFIKEGVNGFLVELDANKIADKMEYVINHDCSKIIEKGMQLLGIEIVRNI